MTTITPFLWFDDGLEQAIERYRTVFDDVEVHHEQRLPDGDGTFGARSSSPSSRSAVSG